MRSFFRRAGLAALILALTAGLAAGGALATEYTVTDDKEFDKALADTSCTRILLDYHSGYSATAIPAGVSVHVVGNHVWRLPGAASCNVTVESGSAVLCASAGDVGATDGVFVALPLNLRGASAGEKVTAVTAEKRALTLFDEPDVESGGSVTVYASKASLDAAGNVMAVRTTGGEYLLSGGGLARRYAIAYRDVVDASGSAPAKSSNAATINPAYFTLNDTITPAEPALAGYSFLGWTWAGQPDPQKGPVSIDGANLGADLELVAHWAAAKLSGGRGGVNFGGLAATGTAETEEAAALPASDAGAAEQAQSVRIPRGSSATKVSFSDGASLALPPAETPQKAGFPWWPLPLLAAAIALSTLIIVRHRRRARNSAASDRSGNTQL